MRPAKDPTLTYHQRLLTAFILCLLALCAFVSQASCCMPPAPQTPLVDAVIPVEYAHTVEILAMCADGRMQGGSGVRIDNERVLTARHVIVCGDRGGDPDGKTVPAVAIALMDRAGKAHIAFVKVETERDLAVLRVPGLPPVSPVEFGVPQIGEQACATFEIPELGRRCGEVWPHTPTDMDDVLVDFVSEHGNSGGPLWDARGRLIGIVTDLRACMGTGTPQVCTAGAMTLASLSASGLKFAAQ